LILRWTNSRLQAPALSRGFFWIGVGEIGIMVKLARAAFFADVVPETIRRTNLGSLAAGSPVNLELPLSVGGLLDGHIVQGHVDATAHVKRVKRAVLGVEVDIELPQALRPFVVEKGSIAVDGMSLTVAQVARGAGTFRVALIPHTLAVTIAGGYNPGSVVNLEADVVARYAAGMTKPPVVSSRT